MISRFTRYLSIVLAAFAASTAAMTPAATPVAAGSAVVTDGRFTNVYVMPDPDRETWEQHIAPLRPTDAAQFSRASIDRFTSSIMAPTWPSYWDSLAQYGIHPPQFFGSAVASQACVDAAMKDMHNGVLQWDTIRSLANCHTAGMDPSPQVNLIFSPDIPFSSINVIGTGPEMCSTSTERGWHAWGLNVPNFAALPTSLTCMPSFPDFTSTASHEMVEILSDPAGFGMGNPPNYDMELGDKCDPTTDRNTTFAGFVVERYWSNFDNNCQPRLDPPAGSTNLTWVLGQGSPLVSLTSNTHSLDLGLPSVRPTTGAALTDARIVVQTGSDDLNGGSDNVDVTLHFASGSTTTTNINAGRRWGDGETHVATLNLPSPAPRVSDITGVTLTTNFSGGLLGGETWNVNGVALVLSVATGSPIVSPPSATVHTWLDVSSNPLVRFTGSVHDHTESVAPQDQGQYVGRLTLNIGTGNDDLRGGNNPGDNCDVMIGLANGQSITVNNVNGGQTWANWTVHSVDIPLPAGGLHGGDVRSVTLHTGFGGGLSGDNWNVNQVQLSATLVAPPPPPPVLRDLSVTVSPTPRLGVSQNYTVTVKDAANSTPVSGAVVDLANNGHDSVLTTGANGQVTFNGVVLANKVIIDPETKRKEIIPPSIGVDANGFNSTEIIV